MRISIAMATYNGARYLQEQLASFLAQTRLPDELVVCDDHSEDGSLSILQDFQKVAEFEVRIVSNRQRLGFVQNFSKALELCTGDIVFLSDQDDVWLPEKIDTVMNRFSDDPDVQLLIHDVEYCTEDLTRLGQTKIERLGKFCDVENCYVNGMATAVRYGFLRLCLPIPTSGPLAHDRWLHSCASAMHRRKILHQVLALHRRHQANATVSRGPNVDFATTRVYIAREKVHAFFLGSLRRTSILGDEGMVVDNWLQSNRDALVKSGYATAEHLDILASKIVEKSRYEDARAEILSSPRLQRFRGVLSLWRRGGYRSFNGWRSAIKDLLIN